MNAKIQGLMPPSLSGRAFAPARSSKADSSTVRLPYSELSLSHSKSAFAASGKAPYWRAQKKTSGGDGPDTGMNGGRQGAVFPQDSAPNLPHSLSVLIR